MVAEWIPDTTDILYVKRKRDEYIETLESYVAGKEIDQTEEIKRLIDLMFIVGSNKRNIFQIATKEGFNRDLDDEAMIQAIKSFPISNDN